MMVFVFGFFFIIIILNLSGIRRSQLEVHKFLGGYFFHSSPGSLVLGRSFAW